MYLPRHAIAYPRSLQSGGFVPAILHVDSVGGNDGTADGTEALPYQTLGALPAQEGGQHISLKRGSLFREALELTENSMLVSAYGTGNFPVISAADIIANSGWTSEGSNAYSKGITLDNSVHTAWSAAEAHVRAFVDGTPLTRQTSLADVQTNPGSYYAAVGTFPAYTLYIHLPDSSAPSAGNYTIEASIRPYCVHGQTSVHGCGLGGLRGQMNAHIDGSLVLRGDDCAITYSDAMNGSKHNVFVGAGGWLTNVIASEAEYTGPLSLAVVFSNDPAGKDVNVENCAFEVNEFGSGASGIIVHRAAGQADFGNIRFHSNMAKNCGVAFNFKEAASCLMTECLAESCQDLFAVGDNTSNVPLIARDCTVDNPDSVAAGICNTVPNNANITIERIDVSVRGTAFGSVVGLFTLAAGRSGVKIYMDGLKLRDRYTDGYTRIMQDQGGLVDFVNTNMEIESGIQSAYRMNTPSGQFVSDFNTFRNNTLFNQLDGAQTTTVTQWQQNTGQDQHSVVSSP